MDSIKFVTNPKFELDGNNQHNMHDWEPNFQYIARNFLRVLLMGLPQKNHPIYFTSINQFFTQHERNTYFINSLRIEFAQGLRNTYQELLKPDVSRNFSDKGKKYIANCISLMPFINLHPEEKYYIPQYINDELILVTYKAIPLQKTKTRALSNIFLPKYSHVFAYGLEPIDEYKAMNAPRLLIFRGDDYIYGESIPGKVYSILKAGQNPGSSLLRNGIVPILKWINKEPRNLPNVYGHNTGGSLALLFVSQNPTKVNEVFAFNPYGLFTSIFNSNHNECDSPAQINIIQQQINQPLSSFGRWKRGWDVIKISPPKEIDSTDDIIYTGLFGCNIEEVEEEEEEEEFNKLWLSIFIYDFLYYATLPLFISIDLFNKLMQFIYNYYLEIMVLALIAFIILDTPLTMPFIVMDTVYILLVAASISLFPTMSYKHKSNAEHEQEKPLYPLI